MDSQAHPPSSLHTSLPADAAPSSSTTDTASSYAGAIAAAGDAASHILAVAHTATIVPA
jgi:hypothetical protein